MGTYGEGQGSNHINRRKSLVQGRKALKTGDGQGGQLGRCEYGKTLVEMMKSPLILFSWNNDIMVKWNNVLKIQKYVRKS